MEKYLNCPFPGTSADGVRVVLYSQIFPQTPCVCYSPSSMASFTPFHAYQRNYPSVVENAFLSLCVYIPFVIPHYGCQVMSHLSTYVTPLQFYFLSKTWHPFLFDLTFPQQLFVIVCKSSILEMKINCTCLVFVPHCQV